MSIFFFSSLVSFLQSSVADDKPASVSTSAEERRVRAEKRKRSELSSSPRSSPPSSPLQKRRRSDQGMKPQGEVFSPTVVIAPGHVTSSTEAFKKEDNRGAEDEVSAPFVEVSRNNRVESSRRLAEEREDGQKETSVNSMAVYSCKLEKKEDPSDGASKTKEEKSRDGVEEGTVESIWSGFGNKGESGSIKEEKGKDYDKQGGATNVQDKKQLPDVAKMQTTSVTEDSTDNSNSVSSEGEEMVKRRSRRVADRGGKPGESKSGEKKEVVTRSRAKKDKEESIGRRRQATGVVRVSAREELEQEETVGELATGNVNREDQPTIHGGGGDGVVEKHGGLEDAEETGLSDSEPAGHSIASYLEDPGVEGGGLEASSVPVEGEECKVESPEEEMMDISCPEPEGVVKMDTDASEPALEDASLVSDAPSLQAPRDDDSLDKSPVSPVSNSAALNSLQKSKSESFVAGRDSGKTRQQGTDVSLPKTSTVAKRTRSHAVSLF